MNSPYTSFRLAGVCLLWVMAGCTAEIVTPPTTMPPPTMPPPTMPPPTMPPPVPPPTMPPPVPPGPTVIPMDVATLDVTSVCTDLEPGETVVSVSPEGHLWLAASSTGSTSLRVLDAWDAAFEGRYQLPVSALQDVQAWSSTTASMIADQQLLLLQDGERLAVSFPATLDAEASLCGDVSERAFVYSAGTLYERDGDSWFEWTGLSAAFPSAELLARDGECFGADDGVWFEAPALEFWRLTATQIARPAKLDAGHHASIRGPDVLALGADNLFVGPEPWSEFSFEQGPARLLAAGGAYAWMVAGTELFRTDGTDFARIVTEGMTEVSELHPHASGGLWVTTDTSVCHFEAADMLRIRGVRTGTLRTDSQLRFGVMNHQGGVAVEASVDGTVLGTSASLDGWSEYVLDLDVGWQTIELSTPGAKRSIDVKLLPAVERSFATDVQPIYATHCIGCHAEGVNPAAPSIDDYADWVAFSVKIKDRVVRRDEMPPLAARLPTWGQEQVTIINEWLSGGMKP